MLGVSLNHQPMASFEKRLVTGDIEHMLDMLEYDIALLFLICRLLQPVNKGFDILYFF